VTGPAPSATPGTATELLDRAIRYAVGTADGVARDLLSGPTPCRGWDLAMLLEHASESVGALCEGIQTGRLGLRPNFPESAARRDPAKNFRNRAMDLLDARPSNCPGSSVIDVAGRPLAVAEMACAGALELAVHGWDISQACGLGWPIPDDLASELLAIAPLFVPANGREPLFGPAVAAGPSPTSSERLVAFLGREPGQRPCVPSRDSANLQALLGLASD